jgi:ABC-type nitrate/sulfonate/bicarbonate transport system ATPase subunit
LPHETRAIVATAALHSIMRELLIAPHHQGRIDVDRVSAYGTLMGLQVRHVFVQFRSARTAAVDRVSLEAQPGAITTILGPTGSGKTTLLLAIAGLIEGEEATVTGDVSINQRVISLPGRWQFPISIAFQRPTFFPWMTLRQNLETLHDVQDGSPLGKAERKRLAETYLGQVGLERFTGLRPHEMSGGMQARANLVRALSFASSLALLDEPFANVDEIIKERLGNLLLDHARNFNVSALMVTHDIRDAVKYSRRVYIMTGSPLQCAEVWEGPATNNSSANLEVLHDEVKRLCERHWYPH